MKHWKGIDCIWVTPRPKLPLVGQRDGACHLRQDMDVSRYGGTSEAWGGGRLPCDSGQGMAVACYRFDALRGEVIADLSGSANDLWKPAHLVFTKPVLGIPDRQSFPSWI